MVFVAIDVRSYLFIEVCPFDVGAYLDAKYDYTDPYHADSFIYVLILTLIPAVLFNIHSLFWTPLVAVPSGCGFAHVAGFHHPRQE